MSLKWYGILKQSDVNGMWHLQSHGMSMFCHEVVCLVVFWKMDLC